MGDNALLVITDDCIIICSLLLLRYSSYYMLVCGINLFFVLCRRCFCSLLIIVHLLSSLYILYTSYMWIVMNGHWSVSSALSPAHRARFFLSTFIISSPLFRVDHLSCNYKNTPLHPARLLFCRWFWPYSCILSPLHPLHHHVLVRGDNRQLACYNPQERRQQMAFRQLHYYFFFFSFFSLMITQLKGDMRVE